MSVAITIPKLGMAMTEGTIGEWLVDDGATVSAGQPIYVLVTDKVENEVEAPISGVIRLLGDAGATYDVGDQIAELV